MRVFPTARFYFEGNDPQLARRTISGGQALSGGEDLIAADGGGSWTLDLTGAYLDDPAIAVAMRALDALSDGGATPLIVPFGDARHQLMGNVTVPIGGLPWWNEEDFADSEPLSVTVGDTALRATQITVTVDKLPAPVRAGITLSIDHATMRHRAYRIAEVLSDDGAQAVLSIRPPLREATPNGAPVEFLDPKCVMHVEDGARTPTTLGFAEGSVRFVEDFSGPYA